MLNVILGLGIVFLGSYVVLRPNFKEWSNPDRGFSMFEKDWHKIFAGGYIVSIVFSLLSWVKSDYNIGVAFIVGMMAGLLGIAAWTDAHVHRVPRELGSLTVLLSFGWAVAALAGGGALTMPLVYNSFLPYIDLSDFLAFAGISFIVGLLGFLGFLRIKSKIYMVGLFISYVALYLIGYALISGIGALPMDSYFDNIWRAALILYTFLGVVWAYDIFLPSEGIGGADKTIFYGIAFAFSWWFSAYLLFVALLIAFTLQLIIHLVAKPLGIGYLKEVKNHGLMKTIASSKAKRQGVEVSDTRLARAVPFVPMLVTGIIGTVVYFI